jgi:hypothetical protein
MQEGNYFAKNQDLLIQMKQKATKQPHKSLSYTSQNQRTFYLNA